MKKKDKTTTIMTDDASEVILFETYNKRYQNRLDKFADQYPDAAHLVDSDEEYGYKVYCIRKENFAIKLLPPSNNDAIAKVTPYIQKYNDNKRRERNNKRTDEAFSRT